MDVLLCILLGIIFILLVVALIGAIILINDITQDGLLAVAGLAFFATSMYLIGSIILSLFKEVL